MTWSLAKAAIDHYMAAKDGALSITFHGAGEPTMEIGLIMKCVTYIEDICGRRANTRYSIVSNGVMPPQTLDWLIDKGFRFSISVDGVPAVQDKQRPLKSGGHSSGFVERTIRRIVESGNPYSVNAVFTEKTYGYMVPSVRYFASLGVKYARFRHAFICGRCKGTDLQSIDLTEYLAHFREVKKAAAESGIVIPIPGYNMPFPHRCGIATGYFAGVSYEGFVTGCTEVTSREHPAFLDFVIGEIDSATGSVALNEMRLTEFRSRTAAKVKGCLGCVMEDYCNGGCMIRCWEYSNDINTPDPDECARSKSLFLSYLEEILEASARSYLHVTSHELEGSK